MRNIFNRAVASRSLKALTALGTVMAMAGVANAQATDAGRTVSNTFTLDYSVNDTPQPRIENSGDPTNFTVDRVIDLTVLTTSPTQIVAPGAGAGAAADPFVTFNVTNDGNDNQGFSLAIDNLTGDFNFVPDSETITVTIPAIPATLANGTTPAQAARPEETTVINTFAGLASFVTSDIPPGVTFSVAVSGVIPEGGTTAGLVEDGDLENIVLTAQVRDPDFWIFEGDNTGGTGTAGDVTGNNFADGNDLVNLAQNVFIDGSGDADAPLDGQFSDTGVFAVATPNLTGAKTVEVLGLVADAAACDAVITPDPDAFSLPGSCVEYTITVTNTFPTGATSTAEDRRATGIDIVDVLPAELQFVSASIGDAFTVAPTVPAATPLPTLGTSCVGGACEVRFEGGELIGPASGAPAEVGTIVIRAFFPAS